MFKKKELKLGEIIAFWVAFPLTAVFVSFFIIFYLDLANGPVVILVLMLIGIVSCIVGTILLRKFAHFYVRLFPLFVFILMSAILLPLAKPGYAPKKAYYYDNPTYTEVMHLANGDVKGVYNEDKTVRIYAGIPYAEAPVGEYRWKEPQQLKNWEGIKDASYFAPKNIQEGTNSSVTDTLVDIYSSRGWYPDFAHHPFETMSEDSLYLNIWRPNVDETNLPILVYIHGGSLMHGSSSGEEYNGEEMAKKGVIMITIAYRLGALGYFAHEDLIAESPNHTTGNYGLLDQIEALKWINANATYFGGDKTNITIAGESAGSSSVSALCVSPLANGLFKRAIGESSSIVSKRPPHTYRKMKDALKMGHDIMKEFGCSSIEELRKVPAEKLVNSQYQNSGMTLDGYALRDDKTPYEVYLTHENNEEALLNGFNLKEADAFVIPTYLFNPTNKDNITDRVIGTFGENVGKKILKLYEKKIEEDAFNAFNEIFSVFWFMEPHHAWSTLARDNGENVYSYLFTKENNYHGTYHSGEIIYAYGNVKRDTHSYRYNFTDLYLSEKMLTYWSNFAKTGNPNEENLTNWETWNTSSKLIELGVDTRMIDDPYVELYPLIEEYQEEQLIKDSINA